MVLKILGKHSSCGKDNRRPEGTNTRWPDPSSWSDPGNHASAAEYLGRLARLEKESLPTSSSIPGELHQGQSHLQGTLRCRLHGST